MIAGRNARPRRPPSFLCAWCNPTEPPGAICLNGSHREHDVRVGIAVFLVVDANVSTHTNCHKILSYIFTGEGDVLLSWQLLW